jgi:hypothetical protein
MDATDKLSMLLPDPPYTLTKEKGVYTTHNHNSLVMFPAGVMDIVTQHQGNLVNYVNSFNVNHLHHIQTSLHGHVAKVFQHGKETTIVVYENDSSTTAMNNKAQELQAEEKAQSDEDDVAILEESDITQPPEEFDTGADEGYENDDEIRANGRVSNETGPTQQDAVIGHHIGEHTEVPTAVTTGTNHPAINHCFTGGSPKLDSLVKLYSMLDKRGVANTLFDKITKWA